MTPAEVRALVRAEGIHLRKELGQTFILDLNFLRFIAREAGVGPGSRVLEIGPGPGLLTRILAERARKVWAVEIDPRLARICRRSLAGLENAEVLEADFLSGRDEINPEIAATLRARLAADGGETLSVVANLPYSVAGPVTAELAGGTIPVDGMTLMVQWEQALRLAAAPATKEYGALSVMAQAYFSARVARKIPPAVFWPRPRVWSAVLRMEPLRPAGTERAALRDLTRGVFRHRRKTIANALERFVGPRAAPLMAAAGVEPSRRADAVTPEEFVRMASAMERTTAGRCG
jgi:16S rRNA (adenine1518-N6/adenine1519-N6)-dimethyltransferase